MIDGSAFSRLTPPVSDRDHFLGSVTSSVTLVEYGDYECPDCSCAHSIVQAISQWLRNDFRFVFRHFPRPELHPHALRAAEAAAAAGAQGKFWQMHDCLFEYQQTLDDESLQEYATRLDINVERFVRAMAAGIYTQRVRDGINSGKSSGVSSTPTFFINGVRYIGAWGKISGGMNSASFQAVR